MLLNLPAELRNRIWQFAVVEDYALQVNCRPPPKGVIRQMDPQQPALSEVCHQIRDETLTTFYGQNTFHFSWFNGKTNPTNILLWLDQLSRYGYDNKLRQLSIGTLRYYDLDNTLGAPVDYLDFSLSLRLTPREIICTQEAHNQATCQCDFENCIDGLKKILSFRIWGAGRFWEAALMHLSIFLLGRHLYNRKECTSKACRGRMEGGQVT